MHDDAFDAIISDARSRKLINSDIFILNKTHRYLLLLKVFFCYNLLISKWSAEINDKEVDKNA